MGFVVVTSVTVAGLAIPAGTLVADRPGAKPVVGTAASFDGSVPEARPPGPSRIAVYGDSLLSEAGQDFIYLANQSGASVRFHAFGGLAICDDLATMAADAQSWHPTAAVIEFSGDNFTTCMDDDPLQSAQYYAKYRQDAQAAISIFHSIGTRVILVGLPLDASTTESANVTGLNQIYQSLAAANPGVVYDDAGQSVMAGGKFAWTLPCLSHEACTGPSGTDVVRAPDGIHFCPDGHTTLSGMFEECNVYSSGAFRFASAMLEPALH